MEVHKKGEKLMFFDFDALYNETQGDAFNSGKKRYYDDKVKNVITSTVDGKFLVTARVEGERTYTCSITFDEQGGLYDYNCDCDRDRTFQYELVRHFYHEFALIG